MGRHYALVECTAIASPWPIDITMADRNERVMCLLEVESTLTDRYKATSPSEDSALEPFLDLLARELAE